MQRSDHFKVLGIGGPRVLYVWPRVETEMIYYIIHQRWFVNPTVICNEKFEVIVVCAYDPEFSWGTSLFSCADVPWRPDLSRGNQHEPLECYWNARCISSPVGSRCLITADQSGSSWVSTQCSSALNPVPSLHRCKSNNLVSCRRVYALLSATCFRWRCPKS